MKYPIEQKNNAIIHVLLLLTNRLINKPIKNPPKAALLPVKKLPKQLKQKTQYL